MKRFFKFLLLITLTVVTVCAVALWWQNRQVALLVDHYPVIHYDRKTNSHTVTIESKRPRNWISLNQVSEEAVGAIVVSEDWAFFQHKGYDVQQIRESFERNMREGRYVRGASTITQQVARNVFLERDKTLKRKAMEFIVAIMLEKNLSKRRILEVYVNIVEWGGGVYGIANASRLYFQKSPAELSAKEGAFLAMLLPSPQRYSVSYRRKELTRFANRSVERILVKMVQAGFITRDQARAQADQPLGFERAAVEEEMLRRSANDYYSN